jgi:hypothetical protein
MVRLPSNTLRECGHTGSAAQCRYCCKSLFALVIKNSPGRRRDFRVKMGGTSSPDDKLTSDLGNAIVAISIGGRGSDCLAVGKLAPGNFGLLQQYLPKPDSRSAAKSPQISMMKRSPETCRQGVNEVSALQSFRAGGACPPVWYRSHRSLRRSPFPCHPPWHWP